MKPRRRRLVVSVATLIALASGGASAFVARDTASAEPAGAATDAGVLSPRRAPDVLHELVAETRLASRVGTFMRSLPPTSCLVVQEEGDEVVSFNADALLTPASALKLTTAAAFLAEVGGTGTFATRINGRRPNAAGVVDGSLVLEGGGDPLLATTGYVTTRKRPPKPQTDFVRLVSELKKAGVKRVTGGIGVYDGLYDNERRVPSWSTGYTATGDVGPIGALAVDDGFSSYLPLVAAPDPALAAGTLLRAAMESEGIVVEGSVFRADSAPTGALVTVQSVPYEEVVSEMVRESDNNTAELLLKELARRVKDGVGTRVKGISARLDVLARLGVERDEVQAIDGSGLDRSDRASCDALITTLTARPGGYDLEDMLPIAAETGTLNDRFLSSPLAGRLRAKTGALNGVTALVGVTDRKSRPRLHFAFIANGSFNDPGGKTLQDRLVAALATYPEAPDAATLAP